MEQHLTPMMRQYRTIKNNYQDAILFFRLGDFYEMFFEDAEIASKELEIVLTARDAGKQQKAPMCGVPFHAAQSYISRLIKKGYKVAICEQITDPKEGKGIVERDVVRVITPGTIVEEEFLNQNLNNYLVSIYSSGEKIGLAYTDYSTGEFSMTELIIDETGLMTELLRLNPAEVVFNKGLSEKIIKWLAISFNPLFSELQQDHYSLVKAENNLKLFYQVNSLDTLGISHLQEGIQAAGALLRYLQTTQKDQFNHIQKPTAYQTTSYMILDSATRRNLELSATITGQKEQGSLLWAIDKTVTAMGSRLLRRWINQPLVQVDLIEERQQGVSLLANSYTNTLKIRDDLKKIYDLERLIGKLNTGNATPQDLLALKQSLTVIPKIKMVLKDFPQGILANIETKLDPLDDIVTLIETGINPEAEASIKAGDIIRDGYSNEIDSLRTISRNSKQWLIKLESDEKNRTGIKSLKIGYNKVFGYYIEVTKSYLSLVPKNYQRKQTLANAERYIIDELKEMENKILSAEEKLARLELEIFNQLKQSIIANNRRIQSTAAAISQIDVLANLAYVAINNNYVRPTINTTTKIILKNARHPVLELLHETSFIANDIYLDNEHEMIHIITGPNMAGKSTFARTVALITLLAQIGSFIPVEQGEIGIVDRIFARVGANDDITTGQSTFMVEMNEVANIIKNATAKSLIILDEVGRGTSTFDGLSIAWAITEYLHSQIKAKTIFTTHYHELTELAQLLPGVQNYNVLVNEHEDSITFLYKISPGCANKSYGIQVAQLAGLPKQLLETAKQVLSSLEEVSSVSTEVAVTANSCNENQSILEIRSDSDKLNEHLIAELQKIDINTMSPLEAINFLAEIKSKLSNS